MLKYFPLAFIWQKQYFQKFAWHVQWQYSKRSECLGISGKSVFLFSRIDYHLYLLEINRGRCFNSFYLLQVLCCVIFSEFAKLSSFSGVSACWSVKWDWDQRWCDRKRHDPHLPVSITPHRRLSMNKILPQPLDSKELMGGRLAIICFVTGYKQQGFLGRELVLIENF